MLVLSRKTNESIVIANDIVITVVEVRGDKVRLGIQAPRDVTVHRQEIFDLIQGQQAEQPPAKPRPLPPAMSGSKQHQPIS